MDYKAVSFDSQLDLSILHSALLLKWSSLAKDIDNSSNYENVMFYCRSLIRVLEILQDMEDFDD